MQDRSLSAGASQPVSPPTNAQTMDVAGDSPEEILSSAPSSQAPDESSILDQSLNTLRETLDEHKGKLAISAAAMLGLLVYYKWGEKSLAKEDPEEYERLQRIKERVRQADDRRQGERRVGGSGEPSAL